MFGNFKVNLLKVRETDRRLFCFVKLVHVCVNWNTERTTGVAVAKVVQRGNKWREAAWTPQCSS